MLPKLFDQESSKIYKLNNFILLIERKKNKTFLPSGNCNSIISFHFETNTGIVKSLVTVVTGGSKAPNVPDWTVGVDGVTNVSIVDCDWSSLSDFDLNLKEFIFKYFLLKICKTYKFGSTNGRSSSLKQ